MKNIGSPKERLACNISLFKKLNIIKKRKTKRKYINNPDEKISIS